ncbi:hypothetical protein CR513_26452, partial [Mucuna pruriens]
MIKLQRYGKILKTNFPKQLPLNISNYFTQLSTMWEKIDNFWPTRDYTCTIACTP